MCLWSDRVNDRFKLLVIIQSAFGPSVDRKARAVATPLVDLFIVFVYILRCILTAVFISLGFLLFIDIIYKFYFNVSLSVLYFYQMVKIYF